MASAEQLKALIKSHFHTLMMVTFIQWLCRLLRMRRNRAMDD